MGSETDKLASLHLSSLHLSSLHLYLQGLNRRRDKDRNGKDMMAHRPSPVLYGLLLSLVPFFLGRETC